MNDPIYTFRVIDFETGETQIYRRNGDMFSVILTIYDPAQAEEFVKALNFEAEWLHLAWHNRLMKFLGYEVTV